jgi:hypothetical protein
MGPRQLQTRHQCDELLTRPVPNFPIKYALAALPPMPCCFFLEVSPLAVEVVQFGMGRIHATRLQPLSALGSALLEQWGSAIDIALHFGAQVT